jgi:hypothetical protein
MHLSFHHKCNLVLERIIQDHWVLLTPPHHHHKAQVRSEGDDDMQEHECSGIKGALGQPIMIMRCISKNGWKGMVGMAKNIAVAILELYKRECLISLLDCGDHMVRWNKQDMKAQGHSTLYRCHNFQDHHYWSGHHLPWELDPVPWSHWFLYLHWFGF